MTPDEYYNFEDRVYVEPTLSRDEQMAFIEKLRGIQKEANEEIEAQTYALGTQVPLNQGGLTSGATDENSYFMSRFQTPQVNNQVAKLKTAAQQTAMNYILKNQSSQMEKRYTDAYQAYLKRQYDMNKRHWLQQHRSSGGGGGSTGGSSTPSINYTDTTSQTKPNVNTQTTGGALDGISLSFLTDPITGKNLATDMNGKVIMENGVLTDYGRALAATRRMTVDQMVQQVNAAAKGNYTEYVPDTLGGSIYNGQQVVRGNHTWQL